jgi:hypothetical protein
MPVTSSPTGATAVTTHPAGSGHGSQTGTRDVAHTCRTHPAVGERTSWTGGTAPCVLHCQLLDQTFGGLSAAAHRGQVPG